MPFKLPFSKTRHYNVVSRSVLVVCVELLDASTLECTLSADCTGDHCLHNVAQRIGLAQVSFIVVNTSSRYTKQWWVLCINYHVNTRKETSCQVCDFLFSNTLITNFSFLLVIDIANYKAYLIKYFNELKSNIQRELYTVVFTATHFVVRHPMFLIKVHH